MASFKYTLQINLTMNFRATKKKILVSIGVIILWYVVMLMFAGSAQCLCSPCSIIFDASDCDKVLVVNILPQSCGCGCGCPVSTPLSEILVQLLTLLFPGILAYLILSLLEKEK